ncbi:MAG: UDP pyrophosphate phosphatase [Alcanivorax borkumensis]|jgi:undecaprenyl-diphosphatase|uniref:Undecaprenyl-diphosphatase n=1 Tax=Alcanivorax borkumensis (strain ATCC 700651 / DSM 11573 / NCIMB 13689 / SK2) TaxID=393595 RepID=UPPP_ALCBS|nr:MULTISPECIES: undecaprenyl-diphosphate phosphatase [Alcanivorax]Q0VQH0.1 RecName: Full=Undecaprenyl-diphosphatase; AltName: Full=Bacitracin resistance protein; AltName: Full=Undecaprenyl pyrophosphate phosphatase [Alcanivorax borkumensis SK2]OJH07663.1 MAG: UDP pyrophosphate phosphatase [Alcanivorax borkumensis]EUC71430.1 UDP pyrophosphate phosphatase [Alcanivorax sp. 97CO-5]PKG02857.1 undecaprenyl-diphosphatase [Alcanivorax sp. 97CO-6]CAL16578.1 bacitracin resistance protein BacA/undecapre
MDWFQALVLALIQGLTEFLPISSSAHLILPSQILGWPDQGLAFDVAVHLGTLLAVMMYYRRDLIAMVGGAGLAVQQRRMNDDLKLGLLVALATIPAVVFGFLGDDFIERELRSALVIAITTLVFGALLWASDAFGKREFSLARLGVAGAIFIGLAQALALIPGTSRSGITITAALALGYRREDAARFSFLLSIPVILGAGLLKTKDLIEQQVVVDWGMMALGVIVSAVTAYLTIVFFIRLLERVGMLPFVVYRLILGVALLFWLA